MTVLIVAGSMSVDLNGTDGLSRPSSSIRGFSHDSNARAMAVMAMIASADAISIALRFIVFIIVLLIFLHELRSVHFIHEQIVIACVATRGDWAWTTIQLVVFLVI